MKNQHTELKVGQYRVKLEISVSNHQPSWKRPLPDHRLGGAYLHIDFDPRPGNNSLSLDMAEWYQTIDGKRSEKRTMLTLDEQTARALFATLKSKFEGK